MIDSKKPLAFILFGITGDLSQKKIIPALFKLYLQKKLPKDFYLIGFSRRNFERSEFEQFLKKILPVNKKVLEFIKMIVYIQGNFSETKSYQKLLTELSMLDKTFQGCFNKIFHLAIPPNIYKEVFKNIYLSGLSLVCKDSNGESFSRLLVEKPFGSDYKSSKKLNDMAIKFFTENDIFRIDHYNAKNFVEKIRKTNFDYKKIKKIEIDFLEKGNVENRASFYDSIGLLSDVVQNHILQILAFIALKPKDQNNISKSVFFNSLWPIKKTLKKGQYIGYRKHHGINELSKTETYFKGILEPKNGNLEGKELLVSSGKAMTKNLVEVRVYFKDAKKLTFNSNKENYNPYEKVISKAIKGEKDIFVGRDEVLSSWKLIDKVKKILKNKPLEFY